MRRIKDAGLKAFATTGWTRRAGEIEQDFFDLSVKSLVSRPVVWVRYWLGRPRDTRTQELLMPPKKLVMKPVKKKKLQVKPVAHVKTETVTQFPSGPVID